MTAAMNAAAGVTQAPAMAPAARRPIPKTPARPSIGVPMTLAGLTLAGFFGILAFWSYAAPLTSAAITQGQIVTDGSRRTVQHLEGGIIRELLVKDGDKVHAGQVLVRLDDTQSSASSDLLRAQYDALRAQHARLTAEINDAPAIEFPADMLARRGEARVTEVIGAQRSLFEARQRAHQGIVAVLKQRAEQLRSEISSYEGLLRSVQEQLVSMTGEMKDVEALVEKGYERRSRLLALQRQLSALAGSKDQQTAMIAKARQAITETDLQIAQQANTKRNEVAGERRDVQVQLADVEEKMRAATDVRARRDVLSPVDGLVTGLRFHTIGGVVKPGDPLLDIVADNEAMMVEVKINPTDIDVVTSGDSAEVRLTAFKQRTMPTLQGHVTYVSADVEVEPKTGVTYYRGRVQIDADQIARIGSAKLSAGMPAEVMVLAGERTLLQYLTQPIKDSFRRSFREQ